MSLTRRDFLRYGAIGVGVVAVAPRVGLAAPRRLTDSDIVECAIYPPIGIARVGDSPTEYFLGPEVPGPHPRSASNFRDDAGRIMRQAQRFRVYGLAADGSVVREITTADAEIEWTVHLANRKAAWYDFIQALDIPESSRPQPLRNERRNKDVADRSQLVIDPGPRSISGAGVNRGGTDGRYRFSDGRFFGNEVPLGELRTDEAGRLIALGGWGNSSSRTRGARPTTFANNEGWHDDTGDGPVDAVVRLGGREFRAKGAWLVVAPPNFAPGIQSIVTMYDLMFEVATKLQPWRKPTRPSFTRQIYPLFERHVRHEWVNAGFYREFGWGAAGNFLEPSTLAALANRGAASRFVRNEVFQRFRNPAFPTFQGALLPPYYGDAVAIPPESPRQWMSVLDLQYEWLQQWAEGDFEADWPAGGPRFASRLEQLAVDEQPGALERAALDECLGGPFHPGCEMTWPVRISGLYSEPFRFKRRSGPEPDFGPVLTPEIALAPNGPIAGGVGPGDISKWMAVPWQTDTGSCLSAYIREEGEYLPTFWPARVPNDVLTWDSYQVLLDPRASRAEKEAAFNQRLKWLRDLPAPNETYEDLRMRFLSNWSAYGIITRQDGPGGAFPDEVWVETGFGAPEGDGIPEVNSPLRFAPRTNESSR